MGKQAFRVGFSLALMVVLLALFLWNVNLGDVGASLEHARPMWMLAAVGIGLISYWLRAIRWGMILRPVGHARHSSLVLVTAVGYAAMTLLPARMGDIVRPILLARRDRLVVSGTLASILTERLFDLWSVLVFFLLFVFFPPAMVMTATARHDLHMLTLTGYVLGAGLIVGSFMALAMFQYQERFIGWITRPLVRLVPKWHRPVQQFLHHFLEGLKILQRPRDLAQTLLMSLLLWWLIFWQVKTVLLAFGLAMPLRSAYLIVTLGVIGLAIPTPGGIGGFHKGVQLGLTSFFGVGLDRATGIAIAYHATCFLPITVIGLSCLPLLHLSLRDATKLTANTSATED